MRNAAIAESRNASKLLESEYSRSGVSEQDLLEEVFDGLEPEVQAYFSEEIEDQQSIYLFDSFAATINHFQMTAAPLQANDSFDRWLPIGKSCND